MEFLSVVEAAARLEVSERRVRQLLQRGQLPGQRLGRAWAVEVGAIDREVRQRRKPGRPYGPSAAWRLLSMAAGLPVSGSDNDLARARHRLRDHSYAELVPKLSRRAVRRRFRAHPGVLGRLHDDRAVVRSGVSAAADVAVDIIAVDEFEGYVADSAIAALIRHYALDERSEQQNVILRVVDDEVWPFEPGQNVAPALIVAVDLMEADDDRARRAGRALAETR